MNTRFTSMILAALATLFLLSGCGTLVIGGKPTYAQNKQDLGGSEYSSTTRGPGYKAETSQSTSRLGYYLGTGNARVYCLYDQGHASSTVRNSSGKTVQQTSQHNRICSPSPEPVAQPPVVSQPTAPKAPTPTPKNATCGDFEKVDTLGLLVRTCYIREELADGRLSCLTGWDEEHSIAGVLQKTGIDSAKRVCNPKVTPTTKEVPAVPPQQPRPNFGRKVPT